MCGLVLGLYSVFVYQYSKAKLVTSAALPFQPWQVFLIRRGSLSACSRSFCRMILASLLHKYHATIFSLTWVVAGCNFGCCTCVHTLDLCIIHTLRRWLRTSSRLCEPPQCLACTTFTPLDASCHRIYAYRLWICESLCPDAARGLSRGFSSGPQSSDFPRGERENA